MLFKLTSHIFNSTPVTFSEDTAPHWLTGEKSVRGSTIDNRWFWKEHVLPLNVGESVDTDFSTITRIK